MGVMLYEFVAGWPPFAGETVEEIFHNSVMADICWDDSETNFSPEIRDLVESMLRKKPHERLGAVHRAARGATDIECSAIKTHPFFFITLEDEGGVDSCVDWECIQEEKACIVPVLEDRDDTSYFDDRADRYVPRGLQKEMGTPERAPFSVPKLSTWSQSEASDRLSESGQSIATTTLGKDDLSVERAFQHFDSVAGSPNQRRTRIMRLGSLTSVLSDASLESSGSDTTPLRTPDSTIPTRRRQSGDSAVLSSLPMRSPLSVSSPVAVARRPMQPSPIARDALGDRPSSGDIVMTPTAGPSNRQLNGDSTPQFSFPEVETTLAGPDGAPLEIVPADFNQGAYDDSTANDSTSALPRSTDGESHCFAIKWCEELGYGFSLRGEFYGNGLSVWQHRFVDVDPDGPAAAAGIRNGMLLTEIGGVCTERRTRAQVARMVLKSKSAGLQGRFADRDSSIATLKRHSSAASNAVTTSSWVPQWMRSKPRRSTPGGSKARRKWAAGQRKAAMVMLAVKRQPPSPLVPRPETPHADATSPMKKSSRGGMLSPLLFRKSRSKSPKTPRRRSKVDAVDCTSKSKAMTSPSLRGLRKAMSPRLRRSSAPAVSAVDVTK
mmetsp:Transcript_21924/g.65566  ORF Transcript_21924/g.65566 Transcript_21924/m.65566 type:complete len:607 (-) Transcript_21924:77-1897(-)